MAYQSEAALEQQFIEQLNKQEYTTVAIPDYDALVENFKAIYSTIAKARPAAVKGTYIKNLVLSTTMGPGIHVSVEK